MFLNMATGGGKTAIALAPCFLRAGLPVFVAPLVALAKEVAERAVAIAESYRNLGATVVVLNASTLRGEERKSED